MPSLHMAIKLVLSAGIIVGVSGNRAPLNFLGALLASLPLTSLLAFVWLYVETGDVERISSLSGSIFWLVLPSLVLFPAVAGLAARGLALASLAASAAATTAAYFAMIKVLGALGIDL
ncbi:MAG: hypothetical protein IPM80_24070 [Proteobacteria bacterium]|nr:hypothetical protein [Pseudomonadota bacterium]